MCRASAPRRRRALLTAFGSLAGVRRATREELGVRRRRQGRGRGHRLLRAIARRRIRPSLSPGSRAVLATGRVVR